MLFFLAVTPISLGDFMEDLESNNPSGANYFVLWALIWIVALAMLLRP